jgi:hypothetical protein
MRRRASLPSVTTVTLYSPRTIASKSASKTVSKNTFQFFAPVPDWFRVHGRTPLGIEPPR